MTTENEIFYDNYESDYASLINKQKENLQWKLWDLGYWLGKSLKFLMI